MAALTPCAIPVTVGCRACGTVETIPMTITPREGVTDPDGGVTVDLTASVPAALATFIGAHRMPFVP